MPLFRALAKNMAASYFGESALRFCNGSYTSVCLYSVIICLKRQPVVLWKKQGTSSSKKSYFLLHYMFKKTTSCIMEETRKF